MDPKAPLNVTQGTVITSITSAFFASVYGTFKGQPIGPLAASAGLNSGIAGATFFSIREYIVSPILLNTVTSGQYPRRQRQIQNATTNAPEDPEHLTWMELRFQKVPDTVISGGLAGGVLNAWKRGRAGIGPGVTTAALLCGVLQLAYNELGIQRVKYVSRVTMEERHGGPIPTPRVRNTTEILAGTASAEAPVTHHTESPKPWSERFFDWLGMQKLSDDEYLERMKRKRDGYLRRIAELEKGQEQQKAGITSRATDKSSS